MYEQVMGVMEVYMRVILFSVSVVGKEVRMVYWEDVILVFFNLDE